MAQAWLSTTDPGNEPQEGKVAFFLFLIPSFPGNWKPGLGMTGISHIGVYILPGQELSLCPGKPGVQEGNFLGALGGTQVGTNM